MALNDRMLCVSSILFTYCLLLLVTYVSMSQELEVEEEVREKTLPVVLVTAYMHGGSSIVGSLFKMDPRTMYIFEPGLAVENWRSILPREIDLNGPALEITEKQKEDFEHYYLQKFSKCDLTNIPTEMCRLINVSANHGEIPAQKCSTKCITDSSRNSIWFPENYKMDSCISRANITLNYYSQFCKKSLYISSKTLRYDMSHLIDLLKQHEDMYIFHLIRNPHGIVNSFLKRTAIHKKDYKALLHSKWTCKKMKHNLDILKSVDKNVSKRIKLLRYEDFVKDPMKFTEDLYKVISKNVPEEVWQWVREVTKSSEDQGRYFRQNSEKTAYKWKNSLTQNQVKIIDSECSPMSTYFEDLKN